MELACPNCRNTLSIPPQLTNPMVRCPHCATVLDVSEALAHAAPAMSAAASPAAYSPGFVAAQQSFVSASSHSPVSKKRSMRSKQSDAWVVCIVLVAVAAGGGFAAYKYSTSQRKVAEQQAEGQSPKTIAYRQACGFVRDHLQQEQPNVAANTRFGTEYKVQRKIANGVVSFIVTGSVDVPLNNGKFSRRPMEVEVRQEAADKWKLVALRYNRDLVYEEELPDSGVPDFKFTDTNKQDRDNDDWIYGNNNNTAPRDNGPGADYYEGQSVAWGMNAAIDQIKESMELNKTLVVWLLDKSASAAGYRQEAAAAISDKYRELNAGASKSDEQPLLTAVAAFGKEVEFLIEEPTADQAAIESAINNIEQEESGQERVFTAIIAAAEKFKDVRKEQGRMVMIVVVSDEAGDDENQIENALALAKKHTMPVSVVGGRAPFGRRAIAGANMETSNDLGAGGKPANLMHQGPETAYPENIGLGFFNPTYGGDDTDAIDSGFGPYTLTRLAVETGGTYFACRADLGGGMRGGRGAVNWNPGASLMYTFDPKIMAKYKPQYVSEKEFQKQLKDNKCRKAVVDAGKLPKVDTMKFVRTDFPRPKDEAQGVRELGDAQKGAAGVEPKVEELFKALKPGEADRSKETSPRYQAAFDLAYGRVLAAKARTEGYNAMLAKMKGGFPYTNEQSSMFKLVPDDSLDAGSQLAKLVKDSKKYLDRVVAEHPDTPWAFLAKRELETPCGWKWVEELPMGAMKIETETESDDK